MAKKPLKIKQILKDLYKIRDELLKDDNKELSKLDEFGKTKHELSNLLEELTVDVQRFTEMKALVEKNKTTIELHSANNTKIKQANILVNKLAQIVEKSSKSEKKRDTIILKKKQVILLANELSVLSKRNMYIQQTEERRPRRHRKRHKDVTIDIGPGLSVISENSEGSIEVQQFMKEVDSNKDIQEEKLDKILSGLNVLFNLSKDIGVALHEQKELLTELDNKMDKTQENLDRQNGRLQELLKNSGGFCKWCSGMVCIVILFSLVGLLLHQKNII